MSELAQQIEQLQERFNQIPAWDHDRLAETAALIEGLRMVEASLTSERVTS